MHDAHCSNYLVLSLQSTQIRCKWSTHSCLDGLFTQAGALRHPCLAVSLSFVMSVVLYGFTKPPPQPAFLQGPYNEFPVFRVCKSSFQIYQIPMALTTSEHGASLLQIYQGLFWKHCSSFFLPTLQSRKNAFCRLLSSFLGQITDNLRKEGFPLASSQKVFILSWQEKHGSRWKRLGCIQSGSREWRTLLTCFLLCIWCSLRNTYPG